MTSSPNPTADAEEWLEKLLFDYQGKSYAPFNKFRDGVIDKGECVSRMVEVRNEAKQAILNHITTNYVPREQVEQEIVSRVESDIQKRLKSTRIRTNPPEDFTYGGTGGETYGSGI